MICPKCGHEQAEGSQTCESCGIVFAKYERYLARKADAAAALKDELANIPIPAPANALFYYARIAILLLIIGYSWRLIPVSLASNTAGNSFLHLINLPFHEAGHIIFRPFGAFITSLGGSLGQLLMPLVCLFVLRFKSRDAFGAAVCLWWFGENFLDMAPYIDDARSLSLPLIGGNTGYRSPYGFHDWEYILTESGLIRLDHTLARIAHVGGSVVMLVAIGMGSYWLWRQNRLLKRRSI